MKFAALLMVPALFALDVRKRADLPDGVALIAANGSETYYTREGALYRRPAERVADLPAGEGRSLSAANGLLYATADQVYRLEGRRFVPVAQQAGTRQAALGPKGELAIAHADGLTVGGQRLYPRDGTRSWAPVDVRGVAYDSSGRLWFASPQGVGRYDGAWQLYTTEDGLPFDDFTTMAAAPDGAVWLGTTRGAIRFDGHRWEYRHGLRWLPGDRVISIAATPDRTAWFLTASGAGAIESRAVSLKEKARRFEEEIDRRHRRTPFGYVHSVRLDRPGDLSRWTQSDTDNDGLWTGMYGAGECFAWAATKDPAARRRARAAFEALRFLQTVTQGGTPPAPPGFVARAILPVSGPDPNQSAYTRAKDEQRRATRDRLWKVLVPRWPLSADRQWYWKADTSSDELDGHYFFYAQYYDLVADTPAEKEEVRRVVVALTDHLIDHNFTLVDWDGKPTRWGLFDPDTLNHDPAFWEERGLNSLSILSYLKVAEHMTGDGKYREAARKLIREHAYAANVLVPKIAYGPGDGNQSDDEMAFMSFYNLLRYETDPALHEIYAQAFHNYWQIERPEMNPLFHFLYAAVAGAESRTRPFGAIDLRPSGDWREDAMDTLERFPLDRVDWRMTNSHRKDLVRISAGRGYRRNGKVIPIDERYVEYWNHDPYQLDTGGNGLTLADGAHYLLPYYLGLHHRFLK